MLAIVFTDIVGSSGKCALVGDEAWIEILIHHFSRARKVLKRFRGFEIEIIGDAFYGRVPLRAGSAWFRCGDTKEDGHAEVKIRAGIHVGCVRIIGNNVYGSMVNYAARVVHAIEDDRIAIFAKDLERCSRTGRAS
jgi:adenylate cyclase